MKGSPAKRIVQRILNRADVARNDDRTGDIQEPQPELHRRGLTGGSLAMGERYMEGWWDCPALDRFIARLLRADVDRYHTVEL
ncbi:MAG: hypothetical protein WBG37_05640 [Desulfobacterales bacterium]